MLERDLGDSASLGEYRANLFTEVMARRESLHKRPGRDEL